MALRVTDTVESPLGPIVILADERAILEIRFGSPVGCLGRSDLTSDCRRQVREFFAGARREFELPLRVEGTPFQELVWQSLSTIPFGQTTTYGNIARRLGRPGSVRAVGAANAKNRLLLVLPCHRVIGASGALTGYRGGLQRKQWLLEHEQRHAKARGPID